MKKLPQIIAHRGLSARFPENTLMAFTKAMDYDIDGIEFDLHPTRDGKIVITHDDTLERCSNGHGLVREKTLAELKALDFGAWKGAQFAGTAIPEFNDLLDLVEECRPELFLCVELKENDVECARSVLTELKKRGRLHRCSIISFHPAMLWYAREFEPSLELHGFEHQATPEEYARYCRMIKRIGFYHKNLTPELVRKYNDLGIKVDTWEPGDKETWEYALRCGVDLITTNAADVITALKHAERN